ncbi:WG repeat-containing protein [Colidextribacter sp. OB.20]|uniref:WG repeat-containing protein n=1 Tax=Colidextribacter sp. OB.20 TaxID=2304568 RepID=UPI001369F953|nr:WG repeat-containing protein [Colidextribacter sp. OB.20]
MKKKALSLALALAMCLSLTVPALAAPQSSYTSPSGITINVTPAPAALARCDHRGEGIFANSSGENHTFYDINGNVLGTGSGYRLMGYFHNGRALVKAYNPYTAEEAFGYIDKTGAMVLPAQFKNAKDFSDGLACVSVDGNTWMYIDKTGARAISRDFTKTYSFADGIALAAVPTEYDGTLNFPTPDHHMFIDKSGNTVYEFPQEQRVSDAGGWYMSDTISPAQNVQGNDSYGTFQHGWMFVQDKAENVYLMDKTGTKRAVPDLNGAALSAYLGNDRLLVNKSSRSAIITMDGTMLMPYIYAYNELDGRFDYGVSRFGTPNHGIVDYSGNIVVPVNWSGAGSGSFANMVDGMTVGNEWGTKQFTYLFWTSDCPYAPGASGQKPVDPEPTNPEPTNPPAGTIPASGTAAASTQAVEVDGKAVEFQMYALKDANGNSTNYVKLRDLAHVLNGTAAQFSVGYDGAISLTTGQPYEDTGSEMTTPFSGDRAYTGGGQSVKINGSAVEMTAINLLDDNGGGYNYFKLRDLGAALGFNVSWSAEKGIFVETGKPYAG